MLNKYKKIFAGLVSISLLIPFPAFSAQVPKPGAACSKKGLIQKSDNKTFTCVLIKKKLVWNAGSVIKSNPAAKPTPSPVPTSTANDSSKPTPAVTPTPTPTNSPSPSVQLPELGSVCDKIGSKIPTSYGHMRCNWPGGPVSNGVWMKIEVNKISTSKSNNYKNTPKESASCDNSGDTFDIPGGYLECRWVHGMQLQWIKINNVKQTFVNAVSPAGIDACRLQNADAIAQTGRNWGAGKAGFPMDRTTKNGMTPKGTNEVLVFGVDFPELRGGNDLPEIMSKNVKLMNDWYRYYSNDQVKMNVTTIDRWINAPRSAKSYIKTGNDGLSANSNRFLAEAAQPFVDLLTPEIDLRKFKTVYMIFPDGEITFDMDLIVRNERFNIKEGQMNMNFFGWGHDLELGESMRWAFFIHETLHDFDIIGHAPGNGWPYSIMQNNTGISMAMNPYEQFLLDWLPVNQIYCQEASTLTKTTISLSPIEREDKQTKMAIIKLSSTKAIVIESHSIDKWSDFNAGERAFPPGFYSVVAYVVDLNKSVAPPVSSDQRSLSNQDYAWAVFIRVDGGKSTKFPYFPVAFGEDIFSAVAVLGDTLTAEGIRIKFVGTGDYETIEISKV